MISLGLDCGTQSTKCIALDFETGAVLADAHRPHELIPGLPPGHMEQHPEDWTAAVDETVRAVLDQLGPRRSEVAAIGVSGQQHGLVVLDENDAVVRPAKLWCDTSTAEQCKRLTRELGGDETVIRETGNRMLPGYTAPKIGWLKENEPDHWRRTASVLLPHDYVNFFLTGNKLMEFGDASGTALFDIRKRCWNPRVIEAIDPGLTRRLPEVGSSLRAAGRLRPELARQWELDQPPLVGAGGGDNMMGAIGTGNVAAGAVTASLGTSGTLYAFAEQPMVDPRGEVAAFCDGTDHWLPLACTMNVTRVTELARGLFDWDFSGFDAAVGSVSPGADGLLLLPYLVGERTPDLPEGCGVLFGMTPENITRAHIARAFMEGVTLGMGYGMDRLRALGIRPDEIRLTGGGSQSAVWRQLCADVFGVPVVGLRAGEGAALGAALQAGWIQTNSNGGGESLPELTARIVELEESTRCEPNAETVERYSEIQKRAERLRETLAAGGLI